MPMNAQDANHPKIMTRDVKPENFLVGLPGTPTESIIHMVHNVDIRGNAMMIVFVPIYMRQEVNANDKL